MDGKVHDGASHQQPELDPENIVGAGGECTSAVKSGGALCSEVREHRNWLIYELYVRQEHAECLNVINEQLEEYGDVCEYALFVKGLLSRRTGELTASLEHFSKVLELSPMNPHYLRQVGQAQFLLRKYSEAIEKLQQAEQAREAQGLRKDWSLQYGIGLCYEYSKEYRKAEEAFRNSLRIQQFDCTVIRLSNILTIQGEYPRAVRLLEEAIVTSPDNPELLTELGLLYLKTNKSAKAFNCLGRCLIHNSSDPKAVMAAASIMQENGEFGVALNKCRVAVAKLPSSAHLWSNIGMCFFGQKNVHAAVACLRKATALSPFEWRISYNLGLVFLHLKQYASAFHYLSASTYLHGKDALAFMYIGITLALMNDVDNACTAYNRAISIDDDPLIRLNYCITLLNCGRKAEARDQLDRLMPMWEKRSEKSQHHPQLAVSPVISRTLGILRAKLLK